MDGLEYLACEHSLRSLSLPEGIGVPLEPCSDGPHECANNDKASVQHIQVITPQPDQMKKQRRIAAEKARINRLLVAIPAVVFAPHTAAEGCGHDPVHRLEHHEKGRQYDTQVRAASTPLERKVVRATSILLERTFEEFDRADEANVAQGDEVPDEIDMIYCSFRIGQMSYAGDQQRYADDELLVGSERHDRLHKRVISLSVHESFGLHPPIFPPESQRPEDCTDKNEEDAEGRAEQEGDNDLEVSVLIEE